MNALSGLLKSSREAAPDENKTKTNTRLKLWLKGCDHASSDELISYGLRWTLCTHSQSLLYQLQEQLSIRWRCWRLFDFAFLFLNFSLSLTFFFNVFCLRREALTAEQMCV